MHRLSRIVTLCLAGSFVGCNGGPESEDPIGWHDGGGTDGPSETNCVNELDDDGDGKVDCLDSDCGTDRSCDVPEDPSGSHDGGGTGGPPETNCVNELDDDGDGKVDCLDTDCSTDRGCDVPQPKLCRIQADCGDRVADVAVPVCVDGKCVAPGQVDPRTGEALITDVSINIIYDRTYVMSAQHPETVVLRFLHPNKLDGTPLNCTEVKTLNGSTEATRSQLDLNQNVNLVYRTIFRVSWGASSAGDYVLPTVRAQFVPKGKNYILYAEAWYGPRAQNNPTGNRASITCLEGIDLTVPDPKVGFAFRP